MPNLKQYYSKKIDELKAQPVKIFALVYPYILVLGIILGFTYVSNLSEVERNNTPASVPDTTIQADLKVVEPKVVPPVDITAASQPSQELISSGKNVFTTVCVSCHGSEGDGKGPGATGLNPQPRDFTKSDGWKNGPKISQIYKTLQEGIPGSAMTAYDYLLPTEKIGLAHYIRQTFMNNPLQDTPDDLILLDQTYQLSKGQVISAQIPVASAVDIVSKENSVKAQNVIDIISRMSVEGDNEGVKLFNWVAGNKARAITTLSYSAAWKGNQQLFINTIINNVNQNGFNGNVYKLSAGQWGVLQDYMSRFF